MSEYTPQVGDRVRVVIEATVEKVWPSIEFTSFVFANGYTVELPDTESLAKTNARVDVERVEGAR